MERLENKARRESSEAIAATMTDDDDETVVDGYDSDATVIYTVDDESGAVDHMADEDEDLERQMIAECERVCAETEDRRRALAERFDQQAADRISRLRREIIAQGLDAEVSLSVLKTAIDEELERGDEKVVVRGDFLSPFKFATKYSSDKPKYWNLPPSIEDDSYNRLF